MPHNKNIDPREKFDLYLESIRDLRESLLQLGKWSPTKPYEHGSDEQLKDHFDQTQQQRQQTSKAGQKKQKDQQTQDYYNDDVNDQRDKVLSKAKSTAQQSQEETQQYYDQQVSAQRDKDSQQAAKTTQDSDKETQQYYDNTVAGKREQQLEANKAAKQQSEERTEEYYQQEVRNERERDLQKSKDAGDDKDQQTQEYFDENVASKREQDLDKSKTSAQKGNEQTQQYYDEQVSQRRTEGLDKSKTAASKADSDTEQYYDNDVGNERDSDLQRSKSVSQDSNEQTEQYYDNDVSSERDKDLEQAKKAGGESDERTQEYYEEDVANQRNEDLGQAKAADEKSDEQTQQYYDAQVENQRDANLSQSKKASEQADNSTDDYYDNEVSQQREQDVGRAKDSAKLADEQTQKYYDETVADERDDDLARAKQTASQSDSNTEDYYDSNVADERDRDLGQAKKVAQQSDGETQDYYDNEVSDERDKDLGQAKKIALQSDKETQDYYDNEVTDERDKDLGQAKSVAKQSDSETQDYYDNEVADERDKDLGQAKSIASQSDKETQDYYDNEVGDERDKDLGQAKSHASTVDGEIDQYYDDTVRNEREQDLDKALKEGAQADGETQDYYDNDIGSQRQQELQKHRNEKTQSDRETQQYYDETVPGQRDETVGDRNALKNQILDRAGIIAENAALTQIFKAIHRQAKQLANAAIDREHETTDELNEINVQSHKNAKSEAEDGIEQYYSEDEGVSLPPDKNTTKARERGASEEQGALEQFERQREASGITTGDVADGSDSDFPYKNEEKQIGVPGQKFVDSNPEKLAKFKDQSGVDNIEELYEKNEEQQQQSEQRTEYKRNLNPFIGNQRGDKFPEPNQDVLGHARDNSIADKESFEVQERPPGDQRQKLFKSWIRPNTERPLGIGTPGTPSAPMSQKIDEMLANANNAQQLVGSYKFFIEKLHGRRVRDGSGEPYRKNPIESRSDEFWPDDLENRMVFPTYVTAFNDGYDVSWSDYKFIGRGEPVWIWEQTTRNLTLEFYIMNDFSAELLRIASEINNNAQEANLGGNQGQSSDGNLDATTDLTQTIQTIGGFKDDQLVDPAGNPIDNVTPEAQEKFEELLRLFPDWGTGTTPFPTQTRGGRTGFVQGQFSGTPELLWRRATFLAQCVYGWYRQDGKLKEQPFVRVRIADFFDVVAVINSLQYTQDEFDVDLNPSSMGAIPMGIKVAINMTIVHEDEPTSDYFRYYHNSSFDTPQTETNKKKYSTEPTKTGDTTMDSSMSGSPLFDRFRQTPQSPLEFPENASLFQSNLNDLDSSLRELEASSGNLNDIAKKERLKRVLQNTQRLLKVRRAVEALTVEDQPVSGIVREGAEKVRQTTSMANQPISESVNIPKTIRDKRKNNQ